MEGAGLVDEHRLAGRHVAQHRESERLERHRFRGGDILAPAHRLVHAQDQGTNAVGIAKGEHAVARDHRHARIRAAATSMHPRNGLEDRVRIEAVMLRRALELEREDVQQHLAVGVRVDVAKIELEQLALERIAVGEIAVVGERDAERRVDVERLRLELGERRSGGRIAAVRDAGVAREVAHVARAEHVAHVARPLEHVEDGPFTRDDAGCVLAAVLQQQQAVVEQLVDRRVRHDADDPAHS
jgi:hypothetical protein